MVLLWRKIIGKLNFIGSYSNMLVMLRIRE